MSTDTKQRQAAKAFAAKWKEFTSKINGNSIFLPGADQRYGENLYRNSKSPENCEGRYWSGDWVTSDAQMAYHFLFSLFSTGTVYSKAQGNKDRYFGMSIRPVTSENHVAL